jgi:drug/metabolite transporter (DMT)-like permease
MRQSQKTTYPLSVWAALVAVYVIWGSTYLAIRFAIETIPPFFMAGTRFMISGLLLYVFTRLAGAARPAWAHWKSAAIISFFLLVVANGGVCWAEQRVPSGITALLVGTVPLWMAFLQWVWKGGERPGWKIWGGIGLGLTGIVLLVFSKGEVGAGRIEPWGALLLVGTSLAWAYGSLYARSAPLPSSALLATAMEMLTGGVMQMAVGFLLGEESQIHLSGVTPHSLEAWIYLTLIGSLVGFTSYIWVLQKSTPALASTYAFVNPVIAVFLGWLLAGEALTPPVFLAAGLIVAAVILITLAPGKPKK